MKNKLYQVFLKLLDLGYSRVIIKRIKNNIRNNSFIAFYVNSSKSLTGTHIDLFPEGVPTPLTRSRLQM